MLVIFLSIYIQLGEDPLTVQVPLNSMICVTERGEQLPLSKRSGVTFLAYLPIRFIVLLEVCITIPFLYSTGWVYDPATFIFLVQHFRNIPPHKFNVTTFFDNAVYDHADNVPFVGGYGEVSIRSKCMENANSEIRWMYAFSSSYWTALPNCDDAFTGSSSSTANPASDIEVYSLYNTSYIPMYNSSIMNSSHVQLLQEWTKQTGWVLCYRASLHGMNAAAFHSRCDNQGATIGVILSNGNIFGGYASVPVC